MLRVTSKCHSVAKFVKASKRYFFTVQFSLTRTLYEWSYVLFPVASSYTFTDEDSVFDTSSEVYGNVIFCQNYVE